MVEKTRLAVHAMQVDNEIWRSHGWRSKSDVDFAVYRKEVKRRFGNTKFSEADYLALEDEHFHSLNEALVRNHQFKPEFQKNIKKSYQSRPSGYKKKLRRL